MLHTHNLLPHTDPHTGKEFKILLVLPTKVAEKISEEGLINPEHSHEVCEVGKVFAVCENSEFQVGDEVLYDKIDRSGDEHLNIVTIDRIDYDVVYEQEIWSRNDEPMGRIFIEPLSEFQVSVHGLALPKSVKNITEKGLVVNAPADSCVKPGDRVEYRKQEHGIYPQVDLNGKVLDLLYEADIFTINGVVAPHRMIIKVDLVAQNIKRSASDAGLLLSNLFIHMLRNLQYAEVTSIGEKAQEKYPMLSPGDTAIIHHVIEHQPYRVLGYEMGKENPIYEYRIINCWNDDSAEIMGKLHWSHNTGKISHITPINNIFLEWNIKMLDEPQETSIILPDSDISNYNNIDDLKNAVSHKKKEAAERAKLKISGIKQAIVIASNPLQKDKLDLLTSEYMAIQQEETRIAQYLSKNHLMICKEEFTGGENRHVITPYEQLYPINLLGKKFLIAHNKMLIAQTKKNMDIKITEVQPIGDNIFVLPIEEQSTSILLIPDSAKEKPNTGTVTAAPENCPAKVGDTVLYRPHVGLTQLIDGKPQLILKRNDLISIISPTK